jgi:hypothetical protein
LINKAEEDPEEDVESLLILPRQKDELGTENDTEENHRHEDPEALHALLVGIVGGGSVLSRLDSEVSLRRQLVSLLPLLKDTRRVSRTILMLERASAHLQGLPAAHRVGEEGRENRLRCRERQVANGRHGECVGVV